MDKFLLHLRILDRILEKKINALIQILNITENQKTVLSGSSHDHSALLLYNGMRVEKQKLIDFINESDKVFEKTYREISPDFTCKAHNHAGLVTRLQGRIKLVTDLDVRIRVQESRNNGLRLSGKRVLDNKSARKRVARIYEKNKQPPI